VVGCARSGLSALPPFEEAFWDWFNKSVKISAKVEQKLSVVIDQLQSKSLAQINVITLVDSPIN